MCSLQVSIYHCGEDISWMVLVLGNVFSIVHPLVEKSQNDFEIQFTFFFFSLQPKWQGRFSDHQLNEQISCLNIFPLSLHKWNKFPKVKYCFFGHKSSLSFFQEQLYENTAKFQDDSFVYIDGGGDIFSRKKLNLPSPIPSKGQALPFGNWLPWQSSISWIRWCITVTYTMGFKGVGFQTVQGSFPCHLGCLCALRRGNTVGFQNKAAVHSCFVDQDML